MTTAVSAQPNAGQALNSLLNNSSVPASSSASNALEDRFLKLLVTQMKNQDPLNPMDNAQITSQIAQINTVNGIEKLNTSFANFSSTMLSTQTLQAAGLIGHGILAAGQSLTLQDGHALGGVQIAAPADAVVVTISTPGGNVLQTMDLGSQDAGTLVFNWDGALKSGGTAIPGKYVFSVTATTGTQQVDVTPLGYGTVGSVGINKGNITLDTDTLGSVAVSDIKQII